MEKINGKKLGPAPAIEEANKKFEQRFASGVKARPGARHPAPFGQMRLGFRSK